MENIFFSIMFGTLGCVVGIISTVVFKYIKNKNLESKATSIIETAEKTAEKIKRNSILETKEETNRLKIEVDKEIKEKRRDLKETEDRITNRENNLDKREELFQKRELSLEDKDRNLNSKLQKIQEKETELEEVKKEQLVLLEKISGFSRETAKEKIMKIVEEDMSKEIATYIKDREIEAKLEVDEKAKHMLVDCMNRYASDVTNEQTISVVNIPNEEMKGRLIGREGRNIRTLEAITGVDLIIDDTPEAVVLSSFDPLRREVAKLTLEALIKDGRIHPARIEELYDKYSNELKKQIKEIGKATVYDLKIGRVDLELMELIGKLKFRNSYGQNALQHAKEVAELTGIMASELNEDVTLAKRAGLFHDIGKAIDFEVEGSHVEIGADIARKYKEHEVVINSIESHHDDKESSSVIATLVAIADALSASRPGARNDSLENYIKRLTQLEEIGNSKQGVEKTFAMQAGRELRVMVKPSEIDDAQSHKIAREIKEEIEETMKYPGTVKVTVIRETRAIEEAK